MKGNVVTWLLTAVRHLALAADVPSPTPSSEEPWPEPGVWVDVSGLPQFSDGRARCTRIALCDTMARPTTRFCQAERAIFFSEFEILDHIDVPCGGVEVTGPRGIVVHGKTSYQLTSVVPPKVKPGDLIRFRTTVELRLSLSTYNFTVGLAGTDPASFQAYADGSLSFEDFQPRVHEHCRLPDVASFEVTWGPDKKLSHHGIVDLPGFASLAVVPGTPGKLRRRAAADAPVASNSTTVFHVTHWKAGSQWIHKILRQCCPNAIVEPGVEEAQVRSEPIRQGGVYPTVYMTKEDFDRVRVPPGSTRFVVIRDLRDTLVSAYYSIKISHPIIPKFPIETREYLRNADVESGLLYLLDHWLEKSAAIQLSWLEADGELILKYEDLLLNDLALLEPALIDHCHLPVTREMLREAVLAARFEALTGGRARGCEDVNAHERKGIAGDWRTHFTDKVKRAFKARYGGLLVAAGYERDLSW